MFVKELEITLENGMKISGELDLPERQGQWRIVGKSRIYSRLFKKRICGK